MNAPSLELLGFSKRFGALAALDEVSVKIAPGAFHALLGENGAGKSTLVKCAMGYYAADAGEILLNGRQVTIGHPREAHALGLGMVYQHFTLVPNMTVLENFVLSREHLPAVIDWTVERQRLRGFFDTTPFTVPLDTPVADLAAGQKQKAEILRQLYLQRTLLNLDEPTSVLTPDEADEVLSTLKQLTRDKVLTIVVITHKFREVNAFCDTVTVLRRGKLVGTRPVSELDNDTMAEMMVGRRETRAVVERETRAPGKPVLQIDKLSVADAVGQLAVDDLSLEIRAGE
ncbi:MAG: ATP-binding cassette domain-containing protein, partial [Rhodospirillaceae bacterium]